MSIECAYCERDLRGGHAPDCQRPRKKTATRIAELEAEVKRLKKLGRTKREPVKGIGGVIQNLREGRNMGVQELAKAAGVNPGAISQIECGRNNNPGWKKIQSIAKGLKMKPSELVTAFETLKKS